MIAFLSGPSCILELGRHQAPRRSENDEVGDFKRNASRSVFDGSLFCSAVYGPPRRTAGFQDIPESLLDLRRSRRSGE